MNKRLKKILGYFLLPLVVFGVSFGVYVYTLAPSIVAGDSTEMVNAALVLGIPHQQSYPFVSLLGHLFSLLPFGPNPAWRVNLMSAFFEALTILLIYFIILRLFLASSVKRLASSLQALDVSAYFFAFSASLFLGFSLTFWQLGTKAEVFALNNFLAAGAIWLTLVFLERKKRGWFYLVVFWGVLAFSHHQTAILVGPALLYLLWREQKEVLFDKKVWFKGLILILVGLLPYYFVLTRLARRDPPLNWGNPADFKGALRALARTDFGSFTYVKEAQKGVPETPIDQTVFYFKSLLDDFTVWGVLLAILGGLYLWKKARKIFYFSSIGLLTGIVFLAFAQLPLKGSFNQATAKRFYLLPNLFVAFFLSFGLLFGWQKFKALRLDYKEKSNLFAKVIVFLGLSLAFLVPLMMNFSQANNRENLGTLKYALDFYLPTEPNAIVMLAGDVANFTGQYVKTVVLRQAQDGRIVFSPGQFHLKWFIPQLKARHPDLIIPAPEPGNRFATTSQVIRANLGRRPIYISPELAFHDPEIEKEFVLWPRNLLFKVRRKGGEEKLEDYRAEGQNLWKSLDLDWFSWVRKNNPLLEEVIISYYARHFHNLGYMYESVKLDEDAVKEYERALEVDPFLADSLKNLGLIYGMKLEPRDYQKGVEYLSKFISVVEKDSPELADSGRYTIAKILEDQAKEMKAWEAREATAAGENE